MKIERTLLVVVAGLGSILVGCSSGSKQAAEGPQLEGVIRLYLDSVPSDVQCLELDVMTSNTSVEILHRRFDLTPGSGTDGGRVTLTAGGLPDGIWLLLAENTYNVSCSGVVFDTPVTWFSPNAASVYLTPGTTADVTISLRRASGNGSVGITTGFEEPPEIPSGCAWTCSPWSYGTGNGCNCNCGCWDPDCDQVGGLDGGAGSADGGSGPQVDAGGNSSAPSSNCSNWQLCMKPSATCQDVACVGWTCPLSSYSDGICRIGCGCPDPDCRSVDSGRNDVPRDGAGGTGGSGYDGGIDGAGGSPGNDAGPACSTCVWSQTFESGDGGFTVSGHLPTWASGVPTSGPGSAHSGSKVWATNLAGNYRMNEDSYLTSPIIDLSGHGLRSVTVSWWDYLAGYGASIEVSKDGGCTWNTISPGYGLRYSWTRESIVLDSSYAVSSFRFRFHFSPGSDPNTNAGWYIDDVCVALGGLGAYQTGFEDDTGTQDAGVGSSYATSGNTSWAWGTPTSGPYPGGAHGGAKVWATNLTGNYGNNENGYLISPPIDLSSLASEASIELGWWHWLQSETSYDFASVEVSKTGGEPWVVVWGPTSGQIYDLSGPAMPGWKRESVPLGTEYAVSSFKVRFHFTSDADNTLLGWYVDDVSIQGSTLDACQASGETPVVPGSNEDPTCPDGGVPGSDAGPNQNGGADASPPVPSCSSCAWGQTFETNNGSFTVSGDLTSWAWGAFATPGFPYDRPEGHSGTHGWATNLSGNYRANEDGYLTSPPINLSALLDHEITLSWWEASMLLNASGAVEVSKDGGGTWTSVYTLVQWIQAVWTRRTVVLDPSYAVSNFQFRFHFTAGSDFQTHLGWYIDDVCVASGGLVKFQANFDQDGAGFTSNSAPAWTRGADPWGEVAGHSGGSNVWATNLTGNYSPNADMVLTSPVIPLSDLSNAASINIRWWDWLESEPSYDLAWVEARANGDGVDGGVGTWSTIREPRSGSNGAWMQQSATISTAYATPNFQLRFHFTSDNVNSYRGWYVDDLRIQGTTIDSCDPDRDTENPVCNCVGPGPGNLPDSTTCGQSMCGADSVIYSCTASGWTATGRSCALTLTVTSPNGGESWAIGSTQELTWDASRAVSQGAFDMWLVGGDGNWVSTVSSVLAVAGKTHYSASWQVNAPARSDYRLTLYYRPDAGVWGGFSANDLSDNTFAVTGSVFSLAVTSPNGGESWPNGSTQELAWDVSSAVAQGAFDMWLVDGDGNWVSTVSSVLAVPDTTHYSVSWQVNAPARSDYRLTLYYRPDAGVWGGFSANDLSDNNFAVTTP